MVAGVRTWRLPALGAAALGLLTGVVELVQSHRFAPSLGALVAGIIAGAAIAFALSLPGITVRGLALGLFFAVAGTLTWTFTDRPGVIWAWLALAGVVCAVWAWPWPSRLRELVRFGASWLGLAYWILGTLGALLVVRAGHFGVAGQRLVYAGMFGLAAMAVVAGRWLPPGRADLSVGVLAGIVIVLALLLLAGSGTLFAARHAIPNHDPSTLTMQNRFWGGPLLYYHPNSMAGLAVAVALRVGPDRAFARWQRLAALGFTGFLLVLDNSKTSLILAGVAAVLHGALLLTRGRRDLPEYRHTGLAILTPFVAIGLVLVFSSGIFQSRFGNGDVTSGRVDTWRTVASDWRAAPVAEKLLGDTRTVRAVVTRINDGAPINGPRRQLNTDSAAVGAFRRGGVLGAVAFLFGIVLLVYHAARRSSPAWFTIAAVALLPSMATEDWLLGGPNGVIWLLLLAGEVASVFGPAGEHDGRDGEREVAASA
jgi:hypothetical protein